jgi:hypothetical protein
MTRMKTTGLPRSSRLLSSLSVATLGALAALCVTGCAAVDGAPGAYYYCGTSVPVEKDCQVPRLGSARKACEWEMER